MSERESEAEGGNPARSLRFASIILTLIVIAGVTLRILWLDRLPGIHGDEGWYGLLAQRWATGEFSISRTPTGNYPGPIHPMLVALGQFVLPSQFITLRIPTVVASIATMALGWFVGRRYFDASTGRLILLLLAILPANIAYARFGWDPSYSGMIALAGVATALNRRIAATAILYGVAIWTHPTNVFIAPLLIMIVFVSERQAGGRRIGPRSVTFLVAMGLFTIAMMLTATHARDFANLPAMFSRLASPSDWFAFLILLARLLAGQPWFQHMAGSDYGALLPMVDGIGLLLLSGAIWFAGSTLRGLRFSHGGIPAGWLAMLVTYGLIAGSAPLNAGTERYGFVLVAPTALVLALALRTWLRGQAGRLREAIVTSVLGLSLIAAMISLYFVPLATRNEVSSDSFKTGIVEPKEATARWLIAHSRSDRPLRLVAEDWWLSWPMAYRLSGHAVTVIDARDDPHEALRISKQRTVDVVYAGSARDRQLAPGSHPVFVATGHDGRAVIRVWERGGPAVKP